MIVYKMRKMYTVLQYDAELMEQHTDKHIYTCLGDLIRYMSVAYINWSAHYPLLLSCFLL